MKNNPRLLCFKNAPAQVVVRKEFAAESQKIVFKAASATEPGGFEGYGAVYGNLDRDNEIIAKGAFGESLPAFVRDGFIADSHAWNQGIATVEVAYEDDYGLFIRCDFHGDPQSQGVRTRTMERVARGKSVGLSVGFMPDEWAYHEETGVRTITKATLYEVSIVTVPCNPLAQVVSAKGAPGQVPATVREFEKFLRDAGYSKERACAIASKGFSCGMQGEPILPTDNEGAAMAEALYLQFRAQSLGVRTL